MPVKDQSYRRGIFIFHSPFTSFLPGPWVHLPRVCFFFFLLNPEALCESNKGAGFPHVGWWGSTFTQVGSCPNSQLTLGLGLTLSCSDATSRKHGLKKFPQLQRERSHCHAAFHGLLSPLCLWMQGYSPFLLLGDEATSCCYTQELGQLNVQVINNNLFFIKSFRLEKTPN